MADNTKDKFKLGFPKKLRFYIISAAAVFFVYYFIFPMTQNMETPVTEADKTYEEYNQIQQSRQESEKQNIDDITDTSSPVRNETVETRPKSSQTPPSRRTRHQKSTQVSNIKRPKFRKSSASRSVSLPYSPENVRNEPSDGAVRPVEQWLKAELTHPESIHVYEWGEVNRMETGNSVVRCRYGFMQPNGRFVVEDNYFVIDAKGNVVGYPKSAELNEPAIYRFYRKTIIYDPDGTKRVVFNDPDDGSVWQVVKWLEAHMIHPESLRVIEWGRVVKTSTDNFVVRCKYAGKGKRGEPTLADQIFYLDKNGAVLGYPKPAHTEF